MEVDLRNEKVGYKIRDAQVQKIPYMLVVGDREVSDRTIAVRNRFEGDQGSMELDKFIDLIKDFVDKKVTKP